jgi:hypothetical protein
VWVDGQRRSHERHWTAVERVLRDLPPDLSRQAKLLEYDLALRYSDTGQFKDIFLGADQFPILSIGTWLLTDVSPEASAQRDDVERRLFVAAVLLAARTHVADAIDDPDSFSDETHIGLVEAFDRQAATALALDFPLGTGGHESGGRFGPAATGVARAALASVGREDLAPAVARMLEPLAAAFQIRDDVASMHRDLQRGRLTHPIEVVARAAGIELEPWPDPNVILGAMVVTDSLPAILETALTRVLESRGVAEELRLQTFIEYLTDVEARFDERLGSVSGQGHRSESGPLVYLSEPTLPKALGMAEGALLADTTFRESWELHREGMFGAPEVASRFPAGLILEILGLHGHQLSREVDAFLSFTDSNGLRYYDHPWSDVDTDTIGVYLRLLSYADDAPRQTDALITVLDCLEREVRATSTVPVWLKNCVAPDPRRPPVMALGEGCGVVAAHLLLGLITDGRLPEVVEIGTRHLLGRIGQVGLAASVNYPPLYALAIFLRLIARLPGGGETAEAGSILRSELETRRQAAVTPAQDAALLVTACFEADTPDLIDPGWITAILKRQRFDGSWVGESFAAAPNRGRYVTWYSSSLLTTAFCYDALMRYSRL